jgi:hypothetical protein
MKSSPMLAEEYVLIDPFDYQPHIGLDEPACRRPGKAEV